MTELELSDAIGQLGAPGFRAKQIYGWLHKGVESFDEMSNLPKQLRQRLDEDFFISNAKIEKRLASHMDDTVKYLYALNDDEYVEAVLMKYHHGYSMCISTQVGCKMGCSFCATGQGGFKRNLLPSEMLAQLTAAQRDNDIRISNVVLMGMGEPLDNFDNVLRFLLLVSSENGMNIGMRHISLSTCGLVDKIYDLMQYKLQLTLSVSLHAPNDELRSRMMPVNNRWGVDELLTACRRYIDVTGRRISFEYSMIDGVNDTDDCARQLGEKLKGMICHVNLIPINSVKGTGYSKSKTDRIRRFIAILAKYGVNATVRRTLGSDIAASCGQLRGKTLENR